MIGLSELELWNKELEAANKELVVANKELAEKFVGLEIVCGTLESHVKGEEYLNKMFEEKEEAIRDGFKEQLAELDGRLAALDAEFDTELFPQCLMAIEGKRWVIGHGFHKAFQKFKESEELNMRLGNCISAAIAEGLRQGLEAGIEYGRRKRELSGVASYDPEAKKKFYDSVARLSNVPFPLLDSWKPVKMPPWNF